MGRTAPAARLDPRFSSPSATATSWPDAVDRLRDGQVFWLTTVRGDGRPHSVPLLAVWLDDALYFSTGPDEQKVRNITRDPHCSLILGSEKRSEGLDIVVEGEARRVTDEVLLGRLATAWEEKYGAEWRFDVRDEAFVHAAGSLREDETGLAYVFEVSPQLAFGFEKGQTYSQTTWRF